MSVRSLFSVLSAGERFEGDKMLVDRCAGYRVAPNRRWTRADPRL